MQKNIYNPFITIKFHSKYGFIMTDNFNKRNFLLDNKLIKSLFSIDSSNKKEFLKNKILIPKGSGEWNAYLSSGFWRDFNSIDAAIFHSFGYRYPFIDYYDSDGFKTDQDRMNEYEKNRGLPSFFKNYSSKKIKLNEPEQFPEINIIDVLSQKIVKNKKINLKVFFDIFSYTCFGNTLKDKNEKRFILKTTPSGGAKHPTEAYFIFPKNSIYPAGVYHYNVKEHALDIISGDDCWEKFNESTYFVYNKLRSKNSVFSVVYTTYVERAMFRYRETRATRALISDVGHLIQNSKQVACSLGFSHITEYKSKETDVLKLLKINKSNEPVIATQTFYQI